MKRQAIAEDIDGYIAAFPTDVRASLQKLRQTIHKAAPRATEKISYQIPTFALEGNLVHFAAYQKHLGFYPGASAIKEFGDELDGYEVSKGTVQFPLGKPVPAGLVTRMVKFRVRENLARAETKKRKS
ncbi:uncharacterized protein YdhG (YjbR/CyaY superfamily) [Povalibacter uvarum]|uniref:Uncharacterized protein YdhG (YjbR/CyaY superfamily) n=1 Tax=Povalibacter uvarum TaxID=732238 RepID=A0A841HNR2_9GAMM|nr:DUF1801 domain-containing protein [Povalibacter uvarum]MBB6093702.1 uncharacterized protein YdhG (YjbR/CyaY superfamily) [Povalibacter uvarum]